MRKTERNFTNKVLESKRGDVQAVKSKIKSSVMAVAFLFAATMPLTMVVSPRNVQAAVTQQRQIQAVNQKTKTNTSKAIKTTTSRKVTSATMIKAYKKYLRKNIIILISSLLTIYSKISLLLLQQLYKKIIR